VVSQESSKRTVQPTTQAHRKAELGTALSVDRLHGGGAGHTQVVRRTRVIAYAETPGSPPGIAPFSTLSAAATAWGLGSDDTKRAQKNWNQPTLEGDQLAGTFGGPYPAYRVGKHQSGERARGRQRLGDKTP